MHRNRHIFNGRATAGIAFTQQAIVRFFASSSETTGANKKKSRGVQKWYRCPLSSCKVWWRSAAARRREKQKLGDIVAICRSILMLISALFRGRNAFSNT